MPNSFKRLRRSCLEGSYISTPQDARRHATSYEKHATPVYTDSSASNSTPLNLAQHDDKICAIQHRYDLFTQKTRIQNWETEEKTALNRKRGITKTIANSKARYVDQDFNRSTLIRQHVGREESVKDDPRVLFVRESRSKRTHTDVNNEKNNPNPEKTEFALKFPIPTEPPGFRRGTPRDLDPPDSYSTYIELQTQTRFGSIQSCTNTKTSIKSNEKISKSCKNRDEITDIKTNDPSTSSIIYHLIMTPERSLTNKTCSAETPPQNQSGPKADLAGDQSDSGSEATLISTSPWSPLNSTSLQLSPNRSDRSDHDVCSAGKSADRKRKKLEEALHISLQDRFAPQREMEEDDVRFASSTLVSPMSDTHQDTVGQLLVSMTGNDKEIKANSYNEETLACSSQISCDASTYSRALPLLYGCKKVDMYKKLNKISEGTYGAVYRAMDKRTGKIVALKHIKYHERVWDEGFPLTSLREISLLLELQTEHVVRLHEIVVDSANPNQVYMVMEYVEHELKLLLDQDRPQFSLSERKSLIYQLLQAVASMHEKWIMHRDLKTSNLLYSNKGELKICDFGMARKFGDPILPYTQNIVTLWYRAPELLLGMTNYTELIDVWSVGCIMGEILLRKPLFGARNEIDALDKIFRLCGTPTHESWPSFYKMPGIKQYGIEVAKHVPTWRKVFPIPKAHLTESAALSEAGIHLLQSLLTCDPEKRINAADALKHPFFTEKPSPQRRHLMPTIPDSNTKVHDARHLSNSRKELFIFDKDNERFGGRVNVQQYLNDLELSSTQKNQQMKNSNLGFARQ